jgi:hypothetical protein
MRLRKKSPPIVPIEATLGPDDETVSPSIDIGVPDLLLEGSIGGDFLRRRISTRLTASLCSQVEKADSPRNVWILRSKSKKTS